jgi:cytidine deaminase
VTTDFPPASGVATDGTSLEPGPAIPSASGSRDGEVGWDDLREAARAAAARAYAPYSGLQVGAAGLCDDGRTVVGCNVENASYGLSLCAECGVVSALRANGASSLAAISVTDGEGAALMPCGRCRQLLLENGGPEMLVDRGPTTAPVALGELVPDAFGPDDLPGNQDR